MSRIRVHITKCKFQISYQVENTSSRPITKYVVCPKSGQTVWISDTDLFFKKKKGTYLLGTQKTIILVVWVPSTNPPETTVFA